MLTHRYDRVKPEGPVPCSASGSGAGVGLPTGPEADRIASVWGRAASSGDCCHRDGSTGGSVRPGRSGLIQTMSKRKRPGTKTQSAAARRILVMEATPTPEEPVLSGHH